MYSIYFQVCGLEIYVFILNYKEQKIFKENSTVFQNFKWNIYKQWFLTMIMLFSLFLIILGVNIVFTGRYNSS